MRNSRTIQLAFLCLLQFVFSCEPRTDDGEGAGAPPPKGSCPSNSNDPCKDLKALRTTPNQVIVNFDDCEFQQHPKRIQHVINKLKKMGIKEEKACPCNPKIKLFTDTAGTGIDPEERMEEVNERLMAEGSVTGNAVWNLQIKIRDYPQESFKPYKIFGGGTLPSKVKVAVIDGGLDWSEYRSYLWTNPNPTPTCGNAHGIDLTDGSLPKISHGSYVSERIIAGLDADSLKIMDLRIFDSNGDGTLFNAICAMSFAIENDAHVINNSWGYYKDGKKGKKNKKDQSLFGLIEQAAFNDIIVVASAGNDGANTDKQECQHFPSTFDDEKYHKDAYNVISVGYLNSAEDDLHPNSNGGKKTVSLAAGGLYPTPNGGIEGSSYAAGAVTNAIVRLKAANPNVSHDIIMKCFLGQIDSTLGICVETKGKLPVPINTDCTPYLGSALR